MNETNEGWSWWISHDAENYEGPFATRKEAMDEARGQCMGEFLDDDCVVKLCFYITEARQDPVMLADWIDVERMIDDANESLGDSDRVGADCDEGPWFDYPRTAFADLEARIKQACTDWQAAHNLVFTCRTFSCSRNEERIVIRAPDVVPEDEAEAKAGQATQASDRTPGSVARPVRSAGEADSVRTEN